MANGTLKVGTITTSTGSGTITIGQSGETIALGSGASQTLAVNTPSFYAKLSGHGSGGNNTDTLIEFNQTEYDTDSDFNTTSFRFVPSVAGKYFFILQVKYDINGDSEVVQSTIYKNTTASLIYARKHDYDTANQQQMEGVSGILTANGTSDYFEGRFFQNSGQSRTIRSEKTGTFFMGYKIIGA